MRRGEKETRNQSSSDEESEGDTTAHTLTARQNPVQDKSRKREREEGFAVLLHSSYSREHRENRSLAHEILTMMQQGMQGSS